MTCYKCLSEIFQKQLKPNLEDPKYSLKKKEVGCFACDYPYQLQTFEGILSENDTDSDESGSDDKPTKPN